MEQDGNTYYLYGNGEMAENQWEKGENGDEWYYFSSGGAMKKGWINDNGDYYYLYDENILAKGWMQQGDKWYYFDNSGKMLTGIMEKNGRKYSLNSDGSLKTGWVEFNEDEKWYHFNDNGIRDNEYISNHEVYRTDRGPWSPYSDPYDRKNDTGYADYSKERLLGINGTFIDFNTDEFVYGIENLPAYQLFNNWKRMFKTSISGDMEDVGLDMIDHFRDGTGADYSNSILTEKVKEHPYTKRYADQMLESVKEGLNMYNGDLTSINKALWGEDKPLCLGERPAYNKPDDIFNGLTLTIDDTWANKVEVNDYYFDGKNYSGTMKITIEDEFGLDVRDIDNEKVFGNVGAFRAWFLLQHYEGFNGAYKPFTTVIELEYPFEGSID